MEGLGHVLEMQAEPFITTLPQHWKCPRGEASLQPPCPLCPGCKSFREGMQAVRKELARNVSTSEPGLAGVTRRTPGIRALKAEDKQNGSRPLKGGKGQIPGRPSS